MPKDEKKKKGYKTSYMYGLVDTEVERPIPSIYPVIDTDLARDNIENDLPDSELQDL
ncbi:MAG: hypothetical protein IJ423_03805 [Clostridia bacterium]|nr:hypothetical protein [Clostridia bacterium]